MGGHYPAGGINLGPALTLGYIAGRDLANATHYEDDGTPAAEETAGNEVDNEPQRPAAEEPGQQAAGLGGHQQDAGGQAENDREQQAEAHRVEGLTRSLEDRVQEVRQKYGSLRSIT
jgi:hypothetical protein